MIRFLRQHAVAAVAGIGVIVCLVCLFIVNSSSENESSPQRVAPAPVSAPQSSGTSSAHAKDVPLAIEPSDILNVRAPAIDLDVTVSGATTPRKTANCKGSDYCIDPPVPDQAAWYGDLPSFPSQNPVWLFGHTSWTDAAYATFNDLPALAAGDHVIVTTRTGTFTYRAEAPALVPYDEAPQSELIFGWVPEKLVLVTCNDEKDSATVVVGYLIEAVPTS